MVFMVIGLNLMVIVMAMTLNLMVIFMGNDQKSNGDLLVINLNPTTFTIANLATWIPNDLIIVGERPKEEYMKW
jgi:hypothetical protein